MMTPREIAYQALVKATKQQGFIQEILQEWQKRFKPADADVRFALEIASGTMRMQRALENIAMTLTDGNKLSLKPKEKLLLFLALYQYLYLDRVPIYAIADETVTIAKRWCHPTFAAFLNAILRKAAKISKEMLLQRLPRDDFTYSLAVRLSYPDDFVAKTIATYGFDAAVEVLEAGNAAPRLMARRRNDDEKKNNAFTAVMGSFYADMVFIDDAKGLAAAAASLAFYIQNITPAHLVGSLAAATPAPRTILDLCASPGGKLLAVHDHYATAVLWANDISDNKMAKLKDNCRKYGLEVTFICLPGQLLETEQQFDLIIVDAPCSNSGVLNKRAEARWRIHTSLDELRTLQLALLNHASTLLSPQGTIWYMTCSILQEENESVIEEVCRTTPLRKVKETLILPNNAGWDGGYACALSAANA